MPRNINKIRKIDSGIFGVIIVLILIGLVAVSSASAVLSFQRFGHNYYYLFRQLIFAGLGVGMMLFISRINYLFWKKWSGVFLLSCTVLLLAVLIPGIGFSNGSARSWFSIGAFLLQPSEFFKLAVVVYLAAWFERKTGAEGNFWFGILPPLLVIGLGLGLILVQPDLGTTLTIAMIVAVVMFGAGTKLFYLGSLALVAIGGVVLLIKAAPYRVARFATFLNPSIDPLGIGYHINQALLAIGSGGFWGYGLGASRQKHNYLPEPIGDSIFAVLAEELGFVRIIMMVLLFALLGFWGLRLAGRAPDKFASLVTIGITAWIMVQAMINIAAISGLAPLTGITLPFISYGGSSLLSLSIACGVLLNISRYRV